MSALEYKKDCVGERFYASRNYCSFRHTYEAPGANRTTVDWNLQLRQARRKPKELSAASAPNLLTANLAKRQNSGADYDPADEAYRIGPYHSESETVGRYQNFANSSHMHRGPRVSSGSAHTIDWQLNLRDSLHRNEFNTKWRRQFSRPQQSFDMMMENCDKENAEYQKSNITPQDRRPDRRSGAISIATIRDDPISFHRWAGCEGTQVGQWRHLIEDRSRGRKTRRAIEAETTLRGQTYDPSGARITDNRSDGCLVEMLGKKKWSGAQSHDPLAVRGPQGDAKLYHLSNLRLLPEADEVNRQLRMSKQPRRTVEPEEPKQGKQPEEKQPQPKS